MESWGLEAAPFARNRGGSRKSLPVHEQTGWAAEIGKSDLRKINSHAWNEADFVALEKLPELWRTSAYKGTVDWLPEKKKGRGKNFYKAVHQFENELALGQDRYKVDIFVKETAGGRRYYHQVLTKKNPSSIQGGASSQARGRQVPINSDSGQNIAQAGAPVNGGLGGPVDSFTLNGLDFGREFQDSLHAPVERYRRRTAIPITDDWTPRDTVRERLEDFIYNDPDLRSALKEGRTEDARNGLRRHLEDELAKAEAIAARAEPWTHISEQPSGPAAEAGAGEVPAGPGPEAPDRGPGGSLAAEDLESLRRDHEGIAASYREHLAAIDGMTFQAAPELRPVSFERPGPDGVEIDASQGPAAPDRSPGLSPGEMALMTSEVEQLYSRGQLPAEVMARVDEATADVELARRERAGLAEAARCVVETLGGMV
jgi:hypothetical protein